MSGNYSQRRNNTFLFVALLMGLGTLAGCSAPLPTDVTLDTDPNPAGIDLTTQASVETTRCIIIHGQLYCN